LQSRDIAVEAGRVRSINGEALLCEALGTAAGCEADVDGALISVAENQGKEFLCDREDGELQISCRLPPRKV
jgi:hypothetical protein